MDILAIDDDLQVLRTLRAELTGQGYQLRTTVEGREGLAEIKNRMPDLVLLGIALEKPDIGGLEFCRLVRIYSNVPIILLSASEEEQDKVKALDLGADDYIVKPFGINELLARMRAVLRRKKAPPREKDQVSVGELTVHLDCKLVILKGKKLELTLTEYNLLKTLAAAVGNVVSNEALLARIWTQDNRTNSTNVRVQINHLRQKIEDNPAQPRYIITVPRIGYYLRAASQKE
jgi:two-component system KDP operon response regulator KdpE